MADNFTAEQVSSGGEIFATDQNAADSVHYPIGKIAWGALNTFNITDTASPFPVRLFGAGLSSVSPLFVSNDTVTPLNVSGTLTVTGNRSDDAASTAGSPGISVLGVNRTDSVGANDYGFLRINADRFLQVSNDTAHPVIIRGAGDSTVPISGTVAISNPTDTTVSITGYVAPSTTVTVSNQDTTMTVQFPSQQQIFYNRTDDQTSSVGASLFPMGGVNRTDSIDANDYGFLRINADRFLQVSNDTAHPVVVRGVGSSAITISGAASPYAASSATGAVVPVSLALSSLAQTVMTAVGRLYGYSISNPDTAADVWVHIYPDDSAGVTLGTSSAAVNVMAPFGGGREMTSAIGITMSSGMSVAASLSAQSTAHDAPSTTVYATFYYAPST